MSDLCLLGLSKTYRNGVRAVQDLNLIVGDGERLVIVGPSGSGKSTTLRLIAGLESVTAGDIMLAGKSMTHLAPVDRDVAMVFQTDTLYPHLSVRQNMAFGLRMRRVAKGEIEQRVCSLAQMLEIDSLVDRFPHELSGGQRQRVAVGRAMVRQPRVFLLDEPLASLDVQLRLQMRAEIARLQRQQKTTMIYVTHDQQEAMILGDRIVVIRDGQTQQVGTPAEIYHQPANAFVASFIGSPAMSFLEGRVANGVFALQAQSLQLGQFVRDGDTLLGVRPEDVILGGDVHQVLRGVVKGIDELGHERLLHLDVDGQSLVARTTTEIAKIGETLPLAIRNEGLRFFDPIGDRRRLDRPSEAEGHA